jgi:hypothetical protein
MPRRSGGGSSNRRVPNRHCRLRQPGSRSQVRTHLPSQASMRRMLTPNATQQDSRSQRFARSGSSEVAAGAGAAVAAGAGAAAAPHARRHEREAPRHDAEEAQHRATAGARGGRKHRQDGAPKLTLQTRRRIHTDNPKGSFLQSPQSEGRFPSQPAATHCRRQFKRQLSVMIATLPMTVYNLRRLQPLPTARELLPRVAISSNCCQGSQSLPTAAKGRNPFQLLPTARKLLPQGSDGNWLRHT